MSIARKMKVRPDLFLVGEVDGKIVATVMAGYEGHRGAVKSSGGRSGSEKRIRTGDHGGSRTSAATRRLRDDQPECSHDQQVKVLRALKIPACDLM
jgi:hypothetical protein